MQLPQNHRQSISLRRLRFVTLAWVWLRERALYTSVAAGPQPNNGTESRSAVSACRIDKATAKKAKPAVRAARAEWQQLT
jgi:hypothetical protein